MSFIKETKTMEDLYQANLEREEKLSSKKEKIVVDDNSIPVETIKKNNIFNLFITFISLFYKTFIGLPNSIWNSSIHFLMGLIKVCTYVYIMFEITSIKEYLVSFGYSSSFTTIFLGLFTIFSLVQFCVGLFTAAQAFHYPYKMPNSGNEIIVIGGGRMDGSGKSPFHNESKTEMSETVAYMNAKMTGMSNSKKEKYLSNFYGGKL